VCACARVHVFVTARARARRAFARACVCMCVCARARARACLLFGTVEAATSTPFAMSTCRLSAYGICSCIPPPKTAAHSSAWLSTAL